MADRTALRKGSRAARGGRSRAAASLVLAAGLTLTAVASYEVHRLQRNHARSVFAEVAGRPAAACQRNCDLYFEDLRSIRRFYDASRFVERSEFAEFVRDIPRRHRAVEALMWVRYVRREERKALEAGAAADDLSGLRVYDRDADGGLVVAPTRDAYCPVWYVEPLPKHETLLGLDLSTSPPATRAFNAARDTDAPAIFSGHTLFPNANGAVVAVVLPVYRHDLPPDMPRAERLTGFIVGLFRMRDLIGEAVRDSGVRGIEVRVYDAPSPEGREPLVVYSTDAPETTPPKAQVPDLRYVSELMVAGQQWRLVCTATRTYAAATRSWGMWWVAGIGLLLTLLASAYVSAVVGRAEWAEGLVAERTAELSRANEELEQFAYVASHDLQEPLRKITAFGDRLEARVGSGLDEQARDYLTRMQSAARRMQGLINDLLSYSRVTTRGRPFELVDLNEILRGVLSDLEVRVQETDARIDIGVLPAIQADPSQMRQLFQNLIGNALKFRRPDGTPVVSVRGETVDLPDPMQGGALRRFCRITVEDNGIGFEAKHAERIFGVFQRLHARTEYEGSGIGLAICRRVAERHGGSITAQSAPGTGAAFTVLLPVQHADKGIDHDPAEKTDLDPHRR